MKSLFTALMLVVAFMVNMVQSVIEVAKKIIQMMLYYARQRLKMIATIYFMTMVQLANAAVTIDAETGNLSGSIDMGFYLSAVGIAVAALSLVIAVTLGIRTFKGTKNI